MTSANPDSQTLRALRFNPAALASIPDLPARLASLRAAGYQIDDRCCLVAAPAALIADDIAASMNPETLIGREIIVLAETDSTNDLAAQAGRDGAAEGMVIFAESQRAGRGRLDRKWTSPPGLGLLFSVLLRPSRPQVHWPELTFCAALAVARTVEAFTPSAIQIKWPNDVLADGRKIAGILLETHRQTMPFVVIGIGLNVLHSADDFQTDLQAKVTSIVMQSGSSIDRRSVAANLLSTLNQLYSDWQNAPFASIQRACVARGCVFPA